MRVLIYRLIDLQTYRPKLSFPDQENFLKEVVVVFSPTVTMNANSENSQIKHCPCLKYLVMYRPDSNDLQARKNI